MNEKRRCRICKEWLRLHWFVRVRRWSLKHAMKAGNHAGGFIYYHRHECSMCYGKQRLERYYKRKAV